MMNNPIFYWDACIFITYLKGEQIINGALEGIEEIEKKVNKKEASIVTSVITFSEILQSKITPEKFDKFIQLFGRNNYTPYNVDEDIAKLAGEIRDYYNTTSNKLTTPDAIHIATAIHLNVDTLHTFDGCGNNPGLIQFNGTIAGKYSLKIETPVVSQPSLLTNLSDDPKETR